MRYLLTAAALLCVAAPTLAQSERERLRRFTSRDWASPQQRLAALHEGLGRYERWGVVSSSADSLLAKTYVETYEGSYSCDVTVKIVGDPAQQALKLAQSYQRNRGARHAFFIDGLLIEVSVQGPPDQEDSVQVGRRTLSRVREMIYELGGELPDVRLHVDVDVLTFEVNEERLRGTPLLAWLREHGQVNGERHGAVIYEVPAVPPQPAESAERSTPTTDDAPARPTRPAPPTEATRRRRGLVDVIPR